MSTSNRSLSSQASLLLSTLSGQDKSIFTVSEARKILSVSSGAVMTLLSRLEDKKWIIRLQQGKYLIVPFSAGENAEFSENWYIVAKHLIQPNPYYLSHYSALDLHEMTTQPLITIYITTTVRRQKRAALGATYSFIHTDPSKLWGLEDVWVKPDEQVKVSDLERTIVDCLNNPKLCGGISEIAKGIWKKRNDIDYTRLVEYIGIFSSKAVAKRLGFLLDLYHIGGNATAELRGFATSTFILLDPSLPARGKRQSAWHVRVNLTPEELREIIKT